MSLDSCYCTISSNLFGFTMTKIPHEMSSMNQTSVAIITTLRLDEYFKQQEHFSKQKIYHLCMTLSLLNFDRKTNNGHFLMI